MNDVVYARECYQLIGACFEVYKEKGCGFLEAVFQECLELELALQQIPFEAQVPLQLSYKGRRLQQKYVADFVCHGKIVVEIKAVEKLADEHRAQLLNYLHSTGYRLGVLVNFGHYPQLEWERFVL
jgi:GxxExxY protein